MRLLRYGILLVIMAFLSSCTAVTTSTVTRGKRSGKSPDIRVLLEKHATRSSITCDGPYSVSTASGKTIHRSAEGGSVNISVRPKGLVLVMNPGKRTVRTTQTVHIHPKEVTKLKTGGNTYSGYFRILPESNRTFSLVNVLPMEIYLEGVVPYEMGSRNPDDFAALEAQSVTARTYALAKMEQRKDDIFDVYDTVMDQVYRGTTGANSLTSSAVEKTRGVVLSHRGDLAKTYYSSNCGGHTSDIRLVWPDRAPASYLYGVRDNTSRSRSSFCNYGRYFRWRYSWSGWDMGNMLRRTLPRELGVPKSKIGSLIDMRITERTPSGRVRVLEIETTKGTHRVKGDRIRWVLLVDENKKKILPSIMFNLEKTLQGGRLAFVSIVGGGNGHGVGMCQCGALGMAKKGYTYQMILTHYYPNCQVKKVY